MYIQNSNEKYELLTFENIPKTIPQIKKPNKEEAIKNMCPPFFCLNLICFKNITL